MTPANTVDQRFPLNLPAGAPGAPVRVQSVFGPLDYAFDNYRVVLDASATAAGGRQPSPCPPPAARSSRSRRSTWRTSATARRISLSASRRPRVSSSRSSALPTSSAPSKSGDLEDLQALAALVNAAAGTGYEAYLEDGDGQSTGFEQNVGYLVNRARIDSVATDAASTAARRSTSAAAPTCSTIVRRSSSKRASSHTGTPVTVILNHLRSLIDVNSHEPFGTTGFTVGARVREKRRLQAEDLADLIASRINENLVVLGDMNAFEFNDGLVDVIGTLKGSPAPADQVTEPSVDRWDYELFDLADRCPPPERYSYVFEGNAQVLDHVLVNARDARSPGALHLLAQQRRLPRGVRIGLHRDHADVGPRRRCRLFRGRSPTVGVAARGLVQSQAGARWRCTSRPTNGGEAAADVRRVGDAAAGPDVPVHDAAGRVDVLDASGEP